MLFAQDTEDFRSNPLLEKAATRGLMMESLAKTITGNRLVADSAFIVGILSLTDVLLGISMENLASKLNLAQDLQDALMTRSGLLGAVLLITEKAELDELNDVLDVLKQYRLSINAILSAQMDALFEYESIGNESKQ
jgi:EAL and modified HD-GYP domain-containing signal transduction protein